MMKLLIQSVILDDSGLDEAVKQALETDVLYFEIPTVNRKAGHFITFLFM